MRRLTALLLLGLSAAFIPGCGGDEQSPFNSSTGGGSSSWPPESPERQAAGDLYRSVSRLADDGGGAAASDDGVAQRWRATFDGDKRSLAGLLGGGSSAVSAGGTWSSTPKQKVALSPARRNTLNVKEPPGPKTALPPAAAAGAGTQGAGPTMLAFDAFQKKVYETAVPLLSRLGWGARKRKGHDVPMEPFRVTVHHTQGAQTMDEASTIAQVREIQNYHMYGRGREGKENFEDIGYHFLIDGQGRIMEGRRAEVLGAHAEGANTGNIGIALMGDFNKIQPTSAQIGSLRRLVTFLAIKYRKDPKQKGFLEGHKHFTHTDCPGRNLFAMLDALRDAVEQDTNVAADRLTTPSAALANFEPLVVSQPSA